ncbi:YifB family Mg chelatase-like AAA ATPase [Jeotgalibacillus aurantiacus]|uniref:YifB family Mg chelatase-like AAA ATPase n=1 Tax=Jeotgalibacillus aurantiacus TaxID=2763266 RepID=UPI001D0B51EF|nr:YifB family Mg chelatase-like AAA ATPase [Jeotgalibacillus aurantiacus]
MTYFVSSIGLKGLEGYRVTVEVQVNKGMESVTIVGLPDASVRESRERVIAALRSVSLLMTEKKVVVNLSPAEQKKNGPLFDLPIAIAMMKGANLITKEISSDTAFIGALSLDGKVVPVEGMVAAVLAAKKLGFNKLFLPLDPNVPHIDLPELELNYIHDLQQIIDIFNGKQTLSFPLVRNQLSDEWFHDKDFSQIFGHEMAKRAMEIAAAGEHYLMLDGPPGCGKSLLAETFVSILPPLNQEQQLEKISLYQLAGAPYRSLTQPPFRHPHHSASAVSIIGGGSNPKPGEVSLAHKGVLFMDELGEFSKRTLDMMRQPLESHKVTISRAHSTVTYPADAIFIAAMNPCPCGFHGSKEHYCTCTVHQIKTYKNKVSGPILDRIDILLSIQPVNLEQKQFETADTSEVIRSRVTQARERQYERYQEIICNGQVPYEMLIKHSPLTSAQMHWIQKISSQYAFSNRVQIKCIRLARTIADLKGDIHITDQSLEEALTLRKIQHSMPAVVKE